MNNRRTASVKLKGSRSVLALGFVDVAAAASLRQASRRAVRRPVRLLPPVRRALALARLAAPVAVCRCPRSGPLTCQRTSPGPHPIARRDARPYGRWPACLSRLRRLTLAGLAVATVMADCAAAVSAGCAAVGTAALSVGCP